MAPLAVRDLARRDSDTSKTFSIIFAFVAFVVVAACVLWGYFIPKWRQKHQRPSSTRFNCVGGAARYNTPPRQPARFPSHPGVRGISKRPSRDLTIYNPRTESPFTNSPRNGESVSLHDISPIPTAQRSFSTRSKRPTHDYELPKTPGTLSQLALDGGRCRTTEQEQIDIPDMPAPVARLAGRAPPLTKQLSLFPIPSSNPAKRFDTLAHPNLLFSKLEKLDSRKDLSVRVPSAETLQPEPNIMLRAKTYGDSRRHTILQDSQAIKSQAGDMGENEIIGGLSQMETLDETRPHAVIAVPAPVRKLRPKTPNENIRNRYDSRIGRARIVPPRKASLRRHLTPSTEPLTGSASATSDFADVTTPPTSPPPPSRNTSTLLPTPLRLRRAALRAASASPTPVSDLEKLPLQGSLKALPYNLAPLSLQTIVRSKRETRKSTGFYHSRTSSRIAIRKPGPAHTATQHAGIGLTVPYVDDKSLAPSTVRRHSGYKGPKIFRNSGKGSSVYSRDTKGMSILRSPTVPVGNTEQSSTSLFQENPSPLRASSMELVRSKIDDWNLHTGNLDFSSSPTALLHRPLSDIGPRSPRLPMDRSEPLTPRTTTHAPTTFGLTMPVPKICIGRPSDDVFGDGEGSLWSGRVLRRVLDMETAGSESTLSKYVGKTAPGGAEWI